jgi:hypothetical protein
VPPYVGAGAAEGLQQRVMALLQNTGLALDPPAQKDDKDKPPAVSTIDEYVTKRIGDQIKYYRDTAKTYQAKSKKFQRGILWLGALGTLMSSVGAVEYHVASWVPVVTTATAALAAFIQASRIQGMLPLYQESASQLEIALAAWRDATRQQAADDQRRRDEIALVVRCEEIMGRESESWRAEWESKERKGAVDAFLAEVEARGKDVSAKS